jgi:Mlc titration factor MtfA (ptsG expression regulator)
MENSLLLKFILFLSLVPLILYLIKIPKHRRRRRLYKAEFPQDWMDILSSRFALYQHLPQDIRAQLHGHIHIFLYEKNFVGYQGIVINDTIRVVVAAQACVLLLNRKTNYYPHLTNILIYPNVFNHKTNNGQPQPHGRLGESWHRGPIVLSWLHSEQGAANSKDGQNVIMHEFAHQLDQENGPSDGLPILQHNNIKQWSQVLGKEFKALKLKLKFRKKSFLDKYGATNPAEFFAVITEHFFEQPKVMRKKQPRLYHELKKYYQVDPVTWY